MCGINAPVSNSNGNAQNATINLTIHVQTNNSWQLAFTRPRVHLDACKKESFNAMEVPMNVPMRVSS